MVLSSIHTRLTRTSSDLRMLSTFLLPPSPILRADDSLISSTSGEIPILLEAIAHACVSPTPFREPAGPWNLGENLEATGEPVGDMRCLIHDFPKQWVGMESDEMYTATGPLNNHAEPSDAARNAPSGPKNAAHLVHYDFPYGGARHANTPDDCSSLPMVAAGRQDNFKVPRDPQSSSQSRTGFGFTADVPQDDGDQLSMISTFHTYSESTLPPPTFAPPSPSPSTDMTSILSSPTGRQRHRRPLERAGAVRFPGRPSLRLQVSELEARVGRNELSPTKQCGIRWQLVDSAPVASDCTSDAAHSRLNHVTLPEELSWLRHMVIELWIDQEGFRAVRSSMQLIGYSPRTRSLRPYESSENIGSDATAGVAEFMPMRRETFTFHYAALDSPPTLRMVSIAGNDSRDYISRQATLSVKTNGVYTVLGTETFLALDTHGPRLQNMRLRWKFDYLVNDHKVDGTGKTLAGEKTLTPLTFSCSPYLFLASQGRKAGLMHIMKKNLVPRLGSQKLEPPASSNGILQRISHHLTPWRIAAAHGRSHSDAFAKVGHYLHTRSPLETAVRRGTIRETAREQRTRRRRASSAGEDGLPYSRGQVRQSGIVAAEGIYI